MSRPHILTANDAYILIFNDRAHLNTVVWDHITALLGDPALIRAEISKRLEQARTADPATRPRQQLELALAKAGTGITAMIEAYAEQLITIDELRAKMPHLRARETSLRGQIDALDAQAADRDAYLTSPATWKASSPSSAATPPPPPSKTASASCGCSSRTSSSAPRKSPSGTASPPGQAAPALGSTTPGPDTEGDHRPDYLLRWGRRSEVLRAVSRSGCGQGGCERRAAAGC